MFRYAAYNIIQGQWPCQHPQPPVCQPTLRIAVQHNHTAFLATMCRRHLLLARDAGVFGKGKRQIPGSFMVTESVLHNVIPSIDDAAS